jgi:hypothetical protein
MARSMNLLAALFLGCLAPEAAEAIQCKPAEIGTAGAQPSDALARELSRQAWVSLVTVKYGPQWSTPGLDRNQKWNCFNVPTGFGGNLRQCIYRARPCRY